MISRNNFYGVEMAVLLLGFICISLAGVANADISSQNPPAGACLCLSATGVNVRDTACGTVIGSSGTGSCYKYKGQKIGCTLSGTLYQFFETDYGGRSGWIAGTYLNVGSDSQCGAVNEPTEEFRAVFMATVWNVDWPRSSADTTNSQIQQMLDYLNMMESTNMNAIIYQARPVGDAMYSSTIEPWSRFLTGAQGRPPSPSWDPLSFLVGEAHNRGIEVHAWLNPYRANLSPNWDGLTSDHMANRFRQYAYPYGSYLWMDPGASVVVDHLVSVIQDIITRYDVDGIHFDDYFYPYPDGSVQFPDSATYNAYTAAGGSLSRDDWRRDNVNRMVQRVYNVIQSTRPGVKFSISPFGIYRPGHSTGMPSPIAGLDPYTALYADSKLWLQQGWLDFFAPQLYWAISPPAQSYPVLLDWWLDANTARRHIFAANGVYRISDSNWAVSEIENQVALSRDSTRRSKLSLGNIMYSVKYFRDNTKSITDIFQQRVYTKKAIIPAMPWLPLKVPGTPLHLQINANGVLSWQAADQLARWWVVQKLVDTEWEVHDILPAHVSSIQLPIADRSNSVYAVRAMNAASIYSQPATIQL